MPSFLKKHKGSPAYFADTLQPIGSIPAGEPVTLGVFPEEHSLVFKWGSEHEIVVYTRIVDFIVDNEPRIRDGESQIDSSILDDKEATALDAVGNMVTKARKMSTKWFGELIFLDDEGQLCKWHFLERKRSGYYIDIVMSLQAMMMKKYIDEMLGR